MYKLEDEFGSVVKQARLEQKITQGCLAKQVGISLRYISAIENEKKIPRYTILHKIIRILCINPNSIFYPDTPCKESKIEEIVRILYNCDTQTINAVYETVKAIIKKQR